MVKNPPVQKTSDNGLKKEDGDWNSEPGPLTRKQVETEFKLFLAPIS